MTFDGQENAVRRDQENSRPERRIERNVINNLKGDQALSVK